MKIEQAIEQIDSGTQEIPSNWHAGKGLSDGVTWFEVREWLTSLIELPCNCDNGEAYGHHRWCDTYRPPGMSDSDWEMAQSQIRSIDRLCPICRERPRDTKTRNSPTGHWCQTCQDEFDDIDWGAE